MWIYRDAKRPGIYLALFTDPEGDSCFSIYQISWIKMKSNFWKLKTSPSRNFIYNLQTFREFCQVHFYDFASCKFSMKIIFYLPVNTDKPKLVALFVFVCMTASFIAQISSSENVSKRDAIFTPVAKQ